uniref:Uncharacterized protein n=1 Tax=Human betaherpesvirus 6 TaxID=10368 RepID=A0A5P9S7N4_9BETA|nr:hypothetical protein [Human betaherpesvirus 6]
MNVLTRNLTAIPRKMNLKILTELVAKTLINI